MLNFFSYRSNYFINKEEVGGWGGGGISFVLVLMLCCFPSYLIISSAVTYISRHIKCPVVSLRYRCPIWTA